MTGDSIAQQCFHVDAVKGNIILRNLLTYSPCDRDSFNVSIPF